MQESYTIVNDLFHHCLEELAPYADQERVNLQKIDVPTVIELYRAAQERITEEDSTLEKLYIWTSTFLKQQLLTDAIPDKKLHEQVSRAVLSQLSFVIRLRSYFFIIDILNEFFFQKFKVEYYLKNYHGILDRMGVRRNLDLYDAGHYKSLKAADR